MLCMDTEPAIDIVALMKAHQSNVWRYLRMLGCEPAEADDFTQEVFLSVLRQPFEEISERQSGAYLRAVARNLYVSYLRRESRKLPFGDAEDAESAWLEHTPNEDSTPWLDALQTCVQGLDERQREVVKLRYRMNYSREEMAAALDVTAKAVKGLLSRAKSNLKECVEGKLA